jgi:hypothetical protein
MSARSSKGDNWRFTAKCYIAQPLDFTGVEWYNTNIGSSAFCVYKLPA